MTAEVDVIQGTLDLLILKALSLEPMHGWGISNRIQQMSRDVFRIGQGSVYPAVHRFENRGWVTSHFDVVDQFSPTERPTASKAYGHKLDFELDTAVHIFNRLPEDRWIRGVELETSLDYLATGLPKKGDVFSDGSRFLDDASHWSFSFVIVIPIAPF